MPVSDYTPTVADIGAILRARTKTRGGSEAGTFNPAAAASSDQTRPTAEEVTSLIGVALEDITAAFGPDVPDAPGADVNAYRNAVKRLAALGTALQIELTYWPEQVATNRSPYSQLLALYDKRLARALELISEAQGADGGEGGSIASAPSGYPSDGGYPETAIGMEQSW